MNERLFELLQPPPPGHPEYQDLLREVNRLQGVLQPQQCAIPPNNIMTMISHKSKCMKEMKATTSFNKRLQCKACGYGDFLSQDSSSDSK